MLVALNGKDIGGMTQTGLDVELECSGPQITLTVSRYKFAAEVENRICQAEANHFEAVDKSINDERKLDWTDFGAGSSLFKNAINHLEADNSLESTAMSADAPQIVSEAVAVSEIGSGLTCKRASLNEKKIASTKKNGEANKENLEEEDVSFGTNSLPKSFNALQSLANNKDESRDMTNASSLEQQSLDLDQGEDKEEEDGIGLPVTALEDDFARDEDSEQDPNDEEDDGNAWFGCVCGVVHRSLPVFWIQCESCESWYNVSSDCVNFSQEEAEKISWTCLGCPPLDDEDSQRPHSIILEGRNTENLISNAPICPKATDAPQPDHIWASANEANTSASRALQRSDREPSKDEVHPNGTLVFIQEHGWPGVSNEAGVAKVLSSKIDEEGDLLYDVKYIVGCTKRGILAEFVSRHFF